MSHSLWKAMFPPHIWRRGKDYYHEDRVLDIRYHGACITAEVEGTDVYEVTVTINPKTEKSKTIFATAPMAKTERHASIWQPYYVHWKKMIGMLLRVATIIRKQR